MARRALTSILALGLAFTLGAAPAAAAAGYEHLWSIEGAAGGGETAQTAKTVVSQSTALALESGRYTGTVSYADVLGIAAGDLFSQASEIRLVLTGVPAEGGASVLGGFEGTVTLTMRSAPDVEAAADPAILSQPATGKVVYRVTGRWGAAVVGDSAEGELLYETVEVMSRQPATALIRDAGWFNRLEPDDPLGGPQKIAAIVGGGAAPQPGTDTPPQPGDPAEAAPGTTTGGAGASVADVSPTKPRAAGGFWRYVLKGITGAAGAPAPPVPNAFSDPARRLLDARPRGAMAVPEDALTIDLDLAGSYLDAKNRAAGLLGDSGPKGASALSAAWTAAYSAVPGRSAPDGDAGVIALGEADRIAAALAGSVAEGEDELLGRVRAVAATGAVDTGAVPSLRAWGAASAAVASPKAYGSVLKATAERETAVLKTPVPRSGAMADAVLAAADSPAAPDSALIVAGFERREADDADASATGSELPNRVLAGSGSKGPDGTLGVSWQAGSGPSQAAPKSWLALVRADGSVFWLAGEGGAVALTDGTIRGWGYTTPRAHLVDAGRAGRVLALFPTP